MEVLYQLSYGGQFYVLSGGERIWTSEDCAGRSTVCSLWPLGHPPKGTGPILGRARIIPKGIAHFKQRKPRSMNPPGFPLLEMGYPFGYYPCSSQNGTGTLGGVPEWPKGADCKSAGAAFRGSNPLPPT